MSEETEKVVIPTSTTGYSLREMALFERSAGCELGPALMKISVNGISASGAADGMSFDIDAYDAKGKPVRSSRILQVLIWIVQLRDDENAKQDAALDADYELEPDDPKGEKEMSS